jgi:hypothetical protein
MISVLSFRLFQIKDLVRILKELKAAVDKEC